MGKLFKFGVVGVGNTTLSLLCYILLVNLGMYYILANFISYILGIVNSYYWNKNWVFKHNEEHIYVFLKFIIVNLVVLGINTFCLFLLVNKLNVNQYLSQLFATGVGMVVNFIMNKKWTFVEQKKA